MRLDAQDGDLTFSRTIRPVQTTSRSCLVFEIRLPDTLFTPTAQSLNLVTLKSGMFRVMLQEPQNLHQLREVLGFILSKLAARMAASQIVPIGFHLGDAHSDAILHQLFVEGREVDGIRNPVSMHVSYR